MSKRHMRPNPKIGMMMEGFAGLMKARCSDMSLGRHTHVSLARRDEDGDLELDVLKFKVGRAHVAAAAGELGRLGGSLVFREHNTFVPKTHRGHAYMRAMYLDLLQDANAVVISDIWNHSPPMRRTWMALAREPNVFVFSHDGDVLVNISGAPYESKLLDDVLFAASAPSEAAAVERVEMVLSEIGADWSRYSIDDCFRFAED